jgi:hypothetical protein
VEPEERDRVEAACMDKARKRLQAELGVRVERLPHLLETGSFVILKAPANVEEPFYVAQVSLMCFVLSAHQRLSNYCCNTFCTCF